MRLLRHFIMACLSVVALAANGQVYSMDQLHPGTNCIDFNFSVTVRSWQTDEVHFLITVTRKTPGAFTTREPLYCGARCMMFDGQEMIEFFSPYDQGENDQRHVYEFQVAPRYLVSSQFIFRYSVDKDFQKREGVNSIWFFLKDFGPGTASDHSQEPSSIDATNSAARPMPQVGGGSGQGH